MQRFVTLFEEGLHDPCGAEARQDVPEPDASSPGLGCAKARCQQSWPWTCKSLMPTVLALDVQVAFDVQKPDANSPGLGRAKD